MPTYQMNFILSLVLVCGFISCNNTHNTFFTPKGNNIDTIYQTRTRDLKTDKIPDSVFNMQNLKDLSIAGMDCDYGNHTDCWTLKEIPSVIKNLTALRTLSLTLNSISSLPEELSTLKHLKSINLTDNAGLSSLDIITKLDSLETLTLTACGLSKMPADIGKLKQLKELNLQGNNLDSLEQVRIKSALPNCRIEF